MLIQILNVLYLLVAVAMVVAILMQRGAGAAAGSGFGAGASATVFGARGASNFLSTSTKWLAILFFAISLSMAMYASRGVRGPAQDDLGVMGSAPPAASEPALVPDGDIPAAPSFEFVPDSASGDVPSAEPAPETEVGTDEG